jgi:hypothetical protein
VKLPYMKKKMKFGIMTFLEDVGTTKGSQNALLVDGALLIPDSWDRGRFENYSLCAPWQHRVPWRHGEWHCRGSGLKIFLFLVMCLLVVVRCHIGM